MNKIILNNKYSYFLLIIPLLIIPFLQTKILLDINLHIRFLALNVFLLFLSVFFLFIKNTIKVTVNKLYVIYLSFILYSLISLFISNNYADAFYQFVMITIFGILIFFYSVLFQSYSFKIEFIALIFNILAIVVLAITFNDYFKTLSLNGINHQSIYEIKASFSHKNILSEILFVLFPFSLYLLFVENKWFKLIGFVNSLLILFFIIILLTRAVWIALIGGLIITFILFIFISSKKQILSILQNRKTYFFVITFIFVIASSLYIYSRFDSFETIKKSTQKIFKISDSSQHRIELWKRSIDITKESPVLGKGLGSWRIEVLKYGNRNLKSEDNVTFYQRPHNDFLWVLSEQGIIGLFLFLSIFVIVFYYLIQILKKSKLKNEIIFFYLLFYLLIGYLIFSFFSFPRERIEHNMILGIVLGLIIAKFESMKITKTNKYLNIKYMKICFMFIFTFLIFSTYIAYTRLNSEYHLKKAFKARSSGNWNTVINEINKSESAYYHLDPFSTPLRWYSGEAYFKLGNIEMAFTEYQKSNKINPYHIHVLNNLATCYEIKGEHFKAIELYNNAICISPKFNDALLNLTAVYFNAGNIDSATNLINRVDTLSENEKYLPFLQTILKKRIDNKIKVTDNKLIADLMIKIKNNNEWIFNIFNKSRLNCINFDEQLLIDCIFVLKETDKSIDEDEYKKLKAKYIYN